MSSSGNLVFVDECRSSNLVPRALFPGFGDKVAEVDVTKMIKIKELRE